MKRRTIPFSASIATLSTTLIISGCAGTKHDQAASQYNSHAAPTYSGEAERLRNEAVGAPGSNSSAQRGSAANPGDSSRENTDETEPPRQQK